MDENESNNGVLKAIKELDGTVARLTLAFENHTHTGYDGSRKLYQTLPKLETKTVTSNHTVSGDDHVVLVDATSGAVTLTLPRASEFKDSWFHFKKIDNSANAMTLDGYGSETIDGATTKSVTAQYVTLLIVSNGSNWYII